MFKEKGFIKFKIDEYEVTINYVNHDGVLYGLTLGNSNKVKKFNENKDKITAGEGNNAKEFVDVNVNIIADKEQVKKLYDEMTNLKFNHYKTFDDDLVVVEVTIK